MVNDKNVKKRTGILMFFAVLICFLFFAGCGKSYSVQYDNDGTGFGFKANKKKEPPNVVGTYVYRLTDDTPPVTLYLGEGNTFMLTEYRLSEEKNENSYEKLMENGNYRLIPGSGEYISEVKGIEKCNLMAEIRLDNGGLFYVVDNGNLIDHRGIWKKPGKS